MKIVHIVFQRMQDVIGIEKLCTNIATVAMSIFALKLSICIFSLS